MLVGFTGPRYMTDEQAAAAAAEIGSALCYAGAVVVGCAGGLDKLAREQAQDMELPTTTYRASDESPAMPHAAKLQARSKRMVRALAGAGGTLHAWPNKPAPAGLTPDKWQGSGTWGTVRYAVALGVAVELHPLAAVELPDWLSQRQALLF